MGGDCDVPPYGSMNGVDLRPRVRCVLLAKHNLSRQNSYPIIPITHMQFSSEYETRIKSIRSDHESAVAALQSQLEGI